MLLVRKNHETQADAIDDDDDDGAGGDYYYYSHNNSNKQPWTVFGPPLSGGVILERWASV